MFSACQALIRCKVRVSRRWLLDLLSLSALLSCPTLIPAQNIPSEARITPQTALLTNIQQVLDLGAYRARQFPHPVRITGTVMAYSPSGRGFLHDGTTCILISLTNSQNRLTKGNLAEIEGWTESGVYAPMIGSAQARVLGEGSMPAPTKLSVAR